MTRISTRLRFEIMRRDRFRCRYCGFGAERADLVVDHVNPVALGGSTDLANLVTACTPCNAGKGSTAPDEGLLKALEATAPPATTAFQRTVWSLLADNSAAHLTETFAPEADDETLELQLLGGWIFGWTGGYPDPEPEPGAGERAAFRESLSATAGLGYSWPLLYAAADLTGRQKATDMRLNARVLQRAVLAELERARHQLTV